MAPTEGRVARPERQWGDMHESGVENLVFTGDSDEDDDRALQDSDDDSSAAEYECADDDARLSWSCTYFV